MCLAAVGVVVSLLSTVVGVMGQMQAANAAAAQAEYQARIQKNNAIIAGRMAEDSRKRGAEAEAQQRMKTSALIGRQRAVFGARNLDMGSGSPLDILGDTAMLGELDALTTRNNYEREAIGFEAQSSNFTAQANLSKMESDNLKQSGLFNAFATALGGVQTISQNWGTF